MTFANPQALYFLFLIPVIILLHLIFRKRQKIEFPSLLLWHRLQEKQRKFLNRPLLRNLLLFLQILALIIFSFTLAEPEYQAPVSSEKGDVILIVDTSASMGVPSEGGTRIDEAKNIALDIIHNLRDTEAMMIIGASKPPEVVSGFSRNKIRLRSSVREIKSTHRKNAIAETIQLALSFAETGSRIVVISDGAFDPSEVDIPMIEVHTVGQKEGNIGITAFSLRESGGTEDRFQLYSTLENFGDETVAVPLSLIRDNTILEQREISLPPRSVFPLLFTLPLSGGGIITLKIEREDDLSADNQAQAVVGQKPRTQVRLVTPGNYFLESALRFAPDIELRISEQSGDYYEEIIIFDRIEPPVERDGSFLYINTLPADYSLPEYLESRRVTSWEQSHPLLENTNLKGISFLRVRGPLSGLNREKQNIDPLIFAGPTPLAYSFESESKRFIYLGFNLLETDFTLRAAFPIFLANSINWLARQDEVNDIRQLTIGERLPLQNLGRTLEVILPGNNRKRVLPTDRIYPGKTGIHAVCSERGDYLFAINLIDRDESDINPRFPAEKETDQTTSAEGREKRSFFPWILLFALLPFGAEWFVQVRKW